MSMCKNCGTELVEGAAYCAVCGQPVPDEFTPGGEAATPPAAPYGDELQEGMEGAFEDI
ncbi:MAG: zinc ribbon domain-containing protein [Clostridium sp.]|jgi:uncharacterized Zn finger protein (UPF0148 family)|nr:zinc ribbon domain-containing protein [Clostridium sp.]